MGFCRRRDMTPHYTTLFQLDGVSHNANFYSLSPSVPMSVSGMLYYPYLAVFSEEEAVTLSFRGHAYTVEPMTFYLFPTAVLADAPEKRSIHYIYFSSAHVNLGAPASFCVSDKIEARRTVRRMHAAYREGSAASYYAAVSDFYRILSAVVAESDALRRYNGLFLALQYIRSHYTEPEFRLSDIYTSAMIGESSFRHRFTALFGMSPKDYVAHLRLFAAERLLSNGATVAEAASYAGFSSPSHLSRVYRRMRGAPLSFHAAEKKRRGRPSEEIWRREAERLSRLLSEELL